MDVARDSDPQRGAEGDGPVFGPTDPANKLRRQGLVEGIRQEAKSVSRGMDGARHAPIDDVAAAAAAVVAVVGVADVVCSAVKDLCAKFAGRNSFRYHLPR